MVIAIGYGGVPSQQPGKVYALICMTALAMGIRNATVRKLAVQDLTTTVLTLTITGPAADSSLAGGGNPRWQRRIGAAGSMFVGAALGVTEAFSVACALAVRGGFVHLRACTVFLSSQGSAGASRDTDKVRCVRIQALRI
jgi:uncharacterized membrane protein YoaK (UPF0700 family)